ncbi:MAG: glucosaminidase domain-containing protein, partial [Erysipelotrichaceae bacterium]|nr:glucosaminidase domain-containing protein [Erysipelotrichaceae bacterium]
VLNQSQFFDHFGSFYEYQYEYGANAIMMLSLATLESATGRSSLAFTRNNLFGHAAYDNDVEKNASRYLSVDSSVYSHARYYISGSYCNPVKMQFHGGYFGNKSSGMNVSYASDPYWGEKAASNYRQYDETFGSPDLNAYTLGIKTHTESMNVYAEANEEHTLYRVTEDPGHSFIIIGEEYNEEGNWYRIQCDATFDEQYNPEIAYYYDFERHVAYIHQEDIGVYLAGKNEEKQFVTVTFDAGDGFFRNGEQQISYRIPAGNTPTVAQPDATSMEFNGWDITPEPVYENVTYKAVYTPVASIEVAGTPIYQYEINDRIDLDGALLKVSYEDGSNKTIQISTSMISGFDLTVPGDQEVTV